MMGAGFEPPWFSVLGRMNTGCSPWLVSWELFSAHIVFTRMAIGQSCTNALRAGVGFVGSVGCEQIGLDSLTKQSR